MGSRHNDLLLHTRQSMMAVSRKALRNLFKLQADLPAFIVEYYFFERVTTINDNSDLVTWQTIFENVLNKHGTSRKKVEGIYCQR